MWRTANQDTYLLEVTSIAGMIGESGIAHVEDVPEPGAIAEGQEQNRNRFLRIELFLNAVIVENETQIVL